MIPGVFSSLRMNDVENHGCSWLRHQDSVCFCTFQDRVTRDSHMFYNIAHFTSMNNSITWNVCMFKREVQATKVYRLKHKVDLEMRWWQQDMPCVLGVVCHIWIAAVTTEKNMMYVQEIFCVYFRNFIQTSQTAVTIEIGTVSYTHLTLPTIYSV